MGRQWIPRQTSKLPWTIRRTRQAWSRQAHAWRGMCSPIMLGGFRSTLSIRSRRSTGTGAWWATMVRQLGCGGLHCSLHTLGMLGPMMRFLIPFSLILMFRFRMVDGPVQTGPTDMVDSLWAYCPGILFLDLDRAWQSSGHLLRRFQINYPRSSSIRVCIAAWNQLPRDGGGVMSTRVRTASG